MKRIAAWSSVTLSVAVASAADPPADKPVPDCVHVEAYARYGAYGYDHIVTIDNTCTRSAACQVSTDVNPEVFAVTVRSQQKQSIVTFRGSPAYEFSANVRCKLQK
jgi:hypothetical protein